MTESEIADALRLVKKALSSAEDAKKKAYYAASTDQSGNAHRAMRHADDAISSLQKLKRQLKTASGS